MSTAVVLLLALVPAALSWQGGRDLLARLDDPLLAERLAQFRQRVARAFAVCLVLAALAGGPVILFLLVAVPGTLAARYPARRRIYGETWTLPAFVASVLRFWLAMAGPWLMIAAGPALVTGAGPHWLAAGAVLFLLLVGWASVWSRVAAALLGARPLEDQSLLARLREVAARSKAPWPRLMRAGAPGGTLANAFALPSLLFGPGVLIGETLLARLEPEEVTAIFAHEMAHLEHYHPRRLGGMLFTQVVAAGLASLLLPALLVSVDPRLRTLGGWGWAAAVLLALGVAAARHQAHEADSDRRAVELCGDGEALVRALVKLHALAVLPRRLAPEVERAATHPSLARRIQAIRGQAGAVAASLSAPVVLASLEPGRFVVLESDRAHWLEGVPAGAEPAWPALRERASRLESVALGELTELRLRAAGGRVTLHGRDRARRSWTVPLRAEDAAPAQAALDTLDTHLAPHPAAALGPTLRLAALVSAALLLAGAMTGVLRVALVPAFVGTFLPGPGPLLALAATGMAEAALHHARSPWPASPLAAPLLGLLALAAGGLGLRARRAGEERPAGRRVVLALLLLVSVFGLLAAGLALTAAPRLPRLSLAAAAWPSAAVALLGAGAVLAGSTRRRWQGTSLLPLGLAAALAAAGSSWFRARVLDDPWQRAPPVEEQALAVREEGQARADEGLITSLRLSPGGHLWAAGEYDPEEEEDEVPSRRFRLGGFSGEGVSVDAQDLAFVDDDTALTVAAGGKTAEVRVVDAAARPVRVVASSLPALYEPRLAVDRTRGAWRLTGQDLRAGEFVRLSGRLDGGAPAESRWPSRLPQTNAMQTLVAGDGEQVLAVRHRFGPASALAPWMVLLGGLAPPVTELALIGRAGERPLPVSPVMARCQALAGEPAAFACVAPDRDHTGITLVEAAGQVRPLARVQGMLAGEAVEGDGTITGWRYRGPDASVELVRISPRGALGTAVLAGTGARSPYAMAAAGEWAAVAARDGAATRVRLLRLR